MRVGQPAMSALEQETCHRRARVFVRLFALAASRMGFSGSRYTGSLKVHAWLDPSRSAVRPSPHVARTLLVAALLGRSGRLQLQQLGTRRHVGNRRKRDGRRRWKRRGSRRQRNGRRGWNGDRWNLGGRNERGWQRHRRLRRREDADARCVHQRSRRGDRRDGRRDRRQRERVRQDVLPERRPGEVLCRLHEDEGHALGRVLGVLGRRHRLRREELRRGLHHARQHRLPRLHRDEMHAGFRRLRRSTVRRAAHVFSTAWPLWSCSLQAAMHRE